MWHKILSIGLIALVGAVILVSTTGADDAPAPDPQVGAGPLLVPEREANYVPVQVAAGIVAPDGRPIAQLSDASKEFGQAELSLPGGVVYDPQPSYAPNDQYIEILSSVRYNGNGPTVTITTSRLSPAAYAAVDQLGEYKMTLPDGSTAWFTSWEPTTSSTPNQLTFERNGLLISVFSDQPESALKSLAARVVMRR